MSENVSPISEVLGISKGLLRQCKANFLNYHSGAISSAHNFLPAIKVVLSHSPGNHIRLPVQNNGSTVCYHSDTCKSHKPITSHNKVTASSVLKPDSTALVNQTVHLYLPKLTL